MYSGVMRRLFAAGLAVPAALMAGCQSGAVTGPKIISLELVSGSGQAGIVGGQLASPLVVRVADQAGNPAAGVTVSWQVVSGGGTVTPSSTTSGADGRAEATLRLGTALGEQRVRAVLTGAAPVDFTASAQAAPASQVQIESGNNQNGSAGAAAGSNLVVKVSDAFGNAKAGVTVIFTVVQGGGSLSAGTVLTTASGLASTSWTFGPTAGAQQVNATVVGVAPVSFAATVAPAAASRMTLVSGSGQSVPPGTPLPDSLRVLVTDQFNNPVKDVTVNWSVSDGTVRPVSIRTDAAGRAATSWTMGSTGGPKTATASASGLTPVSFSAAGTIVFAAVAAGGRHACGLDAGGVAYCWGYDGDGQLGLGATGFGSGPVFATPHPMAVAGGNTFATLSAGDYHTCGRTLSSNPYCWGKNIDGRVGAASAGPVATAPTHVDGVQVFSRLQAGGAHSCALTQGGRINCWGANGEGQIGIVGAAVIPSDSLAFASPMAVMPATIFSDVSAGGLHSCAVTSGGAGWCWGYGTSGQLGNGGTANANMPVAIGGGLTLTTIVTGAAHSCGLTTAGAAWCWGNNSSGQLGDATTTNRAVPTAVSGGLVFASLTAGTWHTCGVTAAGVAYCWGRNSSGQLGDGTTGGSPSPVAVGGGHLFSALSAGDLQTCGVTTGRVAYCWGSNQFGQLGDGTQTNRSLPQKVAFQP